MKIAFYATGHGYGHLTRLLAIAAKVQEMDPTGEIHIRAPHPERIVRESLDRAPTTFEPVRLDIGLVTIDALRYDPRASLERLSWHYGPEGDALVEGEARWLERSGIDVALLDIPPRAFDACRLAGVPACGFSNFSWDDIWRDIAKEHPGFVHFADLASESHHSCARLFRPPMHLGLTAFPVVEDVPFAARISSRTKEEIRELLGLDNDRRPLVLLAFGGAGMESLPLPEPGLSDEFLFAVTPPIADPVDPFLYFDGDRLESAGIRYHDLLRAADIAISKPGYSTVAEAAANQTALILTERHGFIEGPVILEYARLHLPGGYISNDDLFHGRWGAVLHDVRERMPFDFSGIRCDGAERVARRLLEEFN